MDMVLHAKFGDGQLSTFKVLKWQLKPGYSDHRFKKQSDQVFTTSVSITNKKLIISLAYTAACAVVWSVKYFLPYILNCSPGFDAEN